MNQLLKITVWCVLIILPIIYIITFPLKTNQRTDTKLIDNTEDVLISDTFQNALPQLFMVEVVDIETEKVNNVESTTTEFQLIIKRSLEESQTTVDGFNNLKGQCECGVFDLENPEYGIESALTETSIEVTCDQNGAEICLKMCSNQLYEGRDCCPEIICAATGDRNYIKASLFSRTCDNVGWIYTGTTSHRYICCRNHKIVSCNDFATSSANKL